MLNVGDANLDSVQQHRYPDAVADSSAALSLKVCHLFHPGNNIKKDSEGNCMQGKCRRIQKEKERIMMQKK